MLTTPASLFPELAKFQKELHTVAAPIFVPVKPRLRSEIDDCFQDVAQQVAEFGGSAVNGWMIWLWPDVMAEAVFHAVWKSPAGELVDLTSKEDGEPQILFLPDPARPYEGKRVPSLRLALWDYALVHEFIRLEEDFLKEGEQLHGPDFLGLYEPNEHMKKLQDRKWQVYEKLLTFPRANGTWKKPKTRA